MNFFCLSILLGCFYTVKICSAFVPQCETDTFGTDFLFGFIGNKHQLHGENIHLHITPLQLTARVRVIAPFLIFDRIYTISNFTVITLNGTLIQYENGTQFKGIEISSDVDISVTAFTGSVNCVDCLEGFLALPTNALGTRYITASYFPYSPYNSEFLVAGTESNTDVVMNISFNGRMSINRTARLQKFETFQFKSSGDVTGSIITSSKPVAVFAGSSGAKIPAGLGDYQFMVEQMIPTKYWTTKYIVPPLYPRKYFVLKFLSDNDNTEVHYYNSTNHYAVNMDKGNVVKTLFGTDPVTIIANKPISVIQYGHDGDNMYGNPFMMTAQGVSQFVDSYKFVTQSYYNVGSNTLAITIAKGNVSELLLNGRSLSSWNAVNISVPYPVDQSVILFMNISFNSSYHVTHSYGVKFGAVLYGLHFDTAAYGFPLGLSLHNSENCNNTPHSTVSTQGATDAGYTSTPSQATSGTGYGKWCFHCDDITHLKYCDRVERCQNEDEVCYVQSYTRKLGINLFKSGCINTEQCNNNKTNGGCLQCCNGNFCNSAGCGDHGFQDLGNRGLLCLDCSHIGENEQCNNVQLCHSDQVCVIEKYEWGDKDYQYYMGCTKPQVCTSKRSTSGRIGRNVPVCTHCCHSDFCNLNCTSVDLGPAIIG